MGFATEEVGSVSVLVHSEELERGGDTNVDEKERKLLISVLVFLALRDLEHRVAHAPMTVLLTADSNF